MPWGLEARNPIGGFRYEYHLVFHSSLERSCGEVEKSSDSAAATGGQGLISGRALPLECHKKGLQT